MIQSSKKIKAQVLKNLQDTLSNQKSVKKLGIAGGTSIERPDLKKLTI